MEGAWTRNGVSLGTPYTKPSQDCLGFYLKMPWSGLNLPSHRIWLTCVRHLLWWLIRPVPVLGCLTSRGSLDLTFASPVHGFGASTSGHLALLHQSRLAQEGHP